jgi:hypothetical protein
MDDKHIRPLVSFTMEIVAYGAAGMLLGGGVEKVVTLIPRTDSQNWKCAGLLVLELVLNAVVIWLASVISQKDIFSLLSNGWQGRIFLLLFFVAQGSFARNVQCVFNVSY